MSRVTAFVVIVVVGSASCRTDPDHPRGRDAVPELSGPAVVTVAGRKITAPEATEFAATRDAPTVDDLVARERRVERALAAGHDVSLARKRAMVQALLTDEIESKVGIETVDNKVVEAERAQATLDLEAYSGFVGATIRVGSLELIHRRDQLPPERVKELAELIAKTAERIYSEVPAEDALEFVDAMKFDWVDPALVVEYSPNLKVLRADDPREPKDGWIRSEPLANQMSVMKDGQKGPMINQYDVAMFTVRRSEIAREEPAPDAVQELAHGRALREARSDRLRKLLDGLQRETTVAIHPELLEEGQ